MPRRDERPDEAMIHAWLDGELDAAEAARVERLVAEDAEWAASAAEARGLIAASSRILGALDLVAGDVIPRGGSAAGVEAQPFDRSRVATARVTRSRVPTWMRIAAGFVLVAGVAYLGRDRLDLAPSEMRENTTEVAGAVATPARAEVASDAAAPIAPASPSAPASTQPATITQPATVAASGLDRGVAGGVASSLVSRPAPEPAAMLGAAAGASEPEARAKTTQSAIPAAQSARMARALEGVTVTGVLSADRATEAAERRTMTTGCWRTQTIVRVDSIQTALRVVRTEGDTLVVALIPAGAEARVVRESDTVLRGTARGVSGPPAAFRAERTQCAP